MATQAPRSALLRDARSAIRIGAPPAHRGDVYSFFIDGSWKRMLLVFGACYLLVNAAFAVMYAMQPHSIAGAQGLADAFFFSVQTFATIGYGGMTPATPYAHVLVTIEAAGGLLSVAMATGLIFAKASRPRSPVLFSEPMVLTRHHGKTTLMFRAGNTRGGEIVDAQMRVTVLKDDVSPEGHVMRRLHDVKLMRERSPLFLLSWLLLHEIDDKSPFADVDWDSPGDSFITVIVTLIGHDGTYGQTTYARHNYVPDDVHVGARFVDVTNQTDTGRFIVDYTRFHDTAPDDSFPTS